MTHYISTDIDDEEIILTGGSSHRTISSISASGFSIYGLYSAYDKHAGMSGSGESVKINFKIAENAYKHAIAWALSLKQSFPDNFNEKINEYIKYRDKNFTDLIFNNIFDEEELNDLIKEKKENHSFLDEDSIKRSFYILDGILTFAARVYDYTKKGNEVEISFC